MNAVIAFTWADYARLALFASAAAAILILWIMLGVQAVTQWRDRRRARRRVVWHVPLDDARRRVVKARAAADYARFTVRRRRTRTRKGGTE